MTLSTRHSLCTTLLLLGAVSLAAPPAIADDGTNPTATSTYRPLSPVSDCLNPSRVRDWAYVNDREILVNAGRKKYRILMSYGCPGLAFGHSIRFEPGPGVGRMCGHLNENVIADASRCDVARVELIDSETWNRILEQPGVSLYRHSHDSGPAPYLADRSQSSFDVSRSR
ncbi:MAG TPA: hypothetical protein DDZ76_08075 [Xanthomonadales bacterium]|nr:hypothetical protein [Xanthomonadales bacterium]